MYRVARTDDEVNETLDLAEREAKTEWSSHPDKTYDDGVEATIRWLLGFSHDNPMEASSVT